jgi:hypothetical protein
MKKAPFDLRVVVGRGTRVVRTSDWQLLTVLVVKSKPERWKR